MSSVPLKHFFYQWSCTPLSNCLHFITLFKVLVNVAKVEKTVTVVKLDHSFTRQLDRRPRQAVDNKFKIYTYVKDKHKMSNCYRYTPTHVRGHNRAVYDSLHAPSRQIRSRACVLQAPAPDGKNQFPTADECNKSDACMMGYVCGNDKVEYIKTTKGKKTEAETNCYGCSQGGTYVTTGGAVTGACQFRQGGEIIEEGMFNTEAACTASSVAQCGWKYGCS